MSKYRAEQTLSISGWVCGTEIEITQVTTFDLTKYRPETRIDPAELPTVENVVTRYFIGKTAISLGTIADQFEGDDTFEAWLLSEAAEQAEIARDNAADAKREDRAYDRAALNAGGDNG